MPLSEDITNDLKSALKGGDKSRVSVLRMIKSSIKNKEIEKGDTLNDDEISAILRTFVKRAKESIEQFSQAGRTDLADKEQAELKIIQGYLPEQLSEAQIRDAVRSIITETGASGPGDMGRVMKAVMTKLKGQVDGKLANAVVKEMLEE